MNIAQLIHNPAAWVAAYWLYSAGVSSMPEPVATSGGGYKWLYGFLHVLAGNLDKLASLKGLPK
jgi:hypothetical protein